MTYSFALLQEPRENAIVYNADQLGNLPHKWLRMTDLSVLRSKLRGSALFPRLLKERDQLHLHNPGCSFVATRG